MATKKGRIYGKGVPLKGAPQRFGGQLPQIAPLDPPLQSISAKLFDISNSQNKNVLLCTVFYFILHFCLKTQDPNYIT